MDYLPLGHDQASSARRRVFLAGAGSGALFTLLFSLVFLRTSPVVRQYVAPVTTTHDISDDSHLLAHGLKVYMPPGSRLHFQPPISPAVEVADKVYRSQEGQDSYAEAFFFHGVKSGRYIELGANDGLEHSNTFLFHQAHGWSGTLIEANPLIYRSLVKNRPNDACVHAAVCGSATDLHFIDDGNPAHAGIAGIWEFFPETFKNMYYGGIVTDEDLDAHTREHVSCRPLREILDVLEVTHIDFFSLDVEGAELLVLQSIDWTRVSIDVILMEVFLGDPTRIEQEKALLAAQGYVQFTELPTAAMIEAHPEIERAHKLDAWFVHKYVHQIAGVNRTLHKRYRDFLPTAAARRMAA